MRPRIIEFQAFGPYAGHETVDLWQVSKNGLFLICGKTGIGKTMILDAMTFALYGKSSGHGRDDFEALRCTNADFEKTTFVKFIFENNGRFYLFERRLERKRKNLSPSYNASVKDDDGIWQPLMENPKEKAMNELAASIIGLEYEQFRQVIILPQGQFERLLTSGSDEKEKILTNIFGEEKWQAIAERFYNKAEGRRNELKGIQDRIRNSLLEENCASVPELEASLLKVRAEAERLDEEYRKADYDKTIKRQQDALAVAKRFGDLHRAEERLHAFEEGEKERAEWETALNDAKRAEKVRPLFAAEKEAALSLDRRRKERESALITAEAKKKACEEALVRLREHAEKEKDIEALKEKKIQYEGKRRDYGGLEEAEKELSKKRKAVEKTLMEESKERERCKALSETVLRLQEEYSLLQTEHEELLSVYLAGITGELAGKLEEGKPCPVCGSLEHPHKAEALENSVTKAMVDSKKKAADLKYKELKEQAEEQEKAKKQAELKHEAVERANMEIAAEAAKLEAKKKSLVWGIETAERLEEEIEKLGYAIGEYLDKRERLEKSEKEAREAYTAAVAKINAAEKEAMEAEGKYDEASKALENGLSENGFGSLKEAEGLMLPEKDRNALSSRIADHDAGLKAAKDNLRTLREELSGQEEPEDERSIKESLDEANNAKAEYREKKAVLLKELERLQKKALELKEEGRDIEQRIRETDEDFAFAKKLRGDSGTGLQRYVLGIMFSSVVTAANKMLELVHGGRYRLYRSDEKVQGSNKRGLELKVFDRYSEEHDGRFVSTLSGGEKFLTSLALSIGMSAVAQKSGIRIEALFIDEGFGSLDEESIGDAMNVLNSIKEASGMVGIISHVKLLEEQIPAKLIVKEDALGSHIVRSLG